MAIELGKLVRLVFAPTNGARTQKYDFHEPLLPVLAYEPETQLLLILSSKAHPTRAARLTAKGRAAVERYQRDHWGERGPSPVVRRLAAADPRRPARALGALQRVVYRTRKGGDEELTDYHHDFDEPRPMLALEPETQLLLILGGTYRVETRGIVG